jgi:hypothetical protein
MAVFRARARVRAGFSRISTTKTGHKGESMTTETERLREGNRRLDEACERKDAEIYQLTASQEIMRNLLRRAAERLQEYRDELDPLGDHNDRLAMEISQFLGK